MENIPTTEKPFISKTFTIEYQLNTDEGKHFLACI